MMISEENGLYTIKFNQEFYDEKIISQSIKDFSEFIEAQLENNVVKIKLKQKNVSIPYEFCNYVLALQNDKEL